MRAKPIFTYSLIAGALALPGHALALGLGKLTLESALGQPLSARIELTDVSRGDVDSLHAKVADPNLYRQNNLTYQSTLSQARISVENGGGAPYLKITSPVSVQEPFLDLLVELDWASGRVVRDYTFLLDPPGVGTPAASAAIAPPRAATPTTTRAVSAPPAPAAAAAGAAPRTALTGGDRYTVHRGDTLRGIAAQFKPDQATLDQMLDALFSGNPSAFDGGNMNRLRAGAIVTIPSAAQAQEIAPEEAVKVVHVQAQDWRNYRDRVAAAAPETGGGATRAAAGKIGVAVEESAPAGAAATDKLEVSRNAAAGKGATAEDTIARGKELNDAEARIAQLEKTVAEMQKALDLKNQTLAQLQGQAEAAKGAAVPPTVAVAPPAGATAAAGAVATPSVPSAAAPAAPTAEKAAQSTTEATPRETRPEAKPAAVAQAKPAAEAPGFFSDLLANTPNWGLWGGALVILGGIAALFAARRRKSTNFEDSIIAGTDIKTNTVFGSTGGGVVNTGDNSLASDFSREGLGNIDTDEVDPIAEAEVYLAYGRDAQAEEILKDALKKDPQRQEIYLKLLEIHSQHNKPSAFETVASELFAVSHGQGDVWHKAVTLGRQLDPSNPMFQDDAGAAVRPGAEPAGTSPVTASMPASAPTQARPAAARTAAEVVASAAGTSTLGGDTLPLTHSAASTPMPFHEGDFSIAPASTSPMKSAADILAGAESALARSASTPVAAVAAAEKSRLSIADAAAGATGAGAGGVVAGAAIATPSAFATTGDLSERVDTSAAPHRFDLDFHLDDADRPVPLRPVAETRAGPMLSGSLGAFGAPATPLDLDKLDLSFDPNHPAFEDPTPSVLDGQWHDAATKLDLAKAYQEMGDREGARGILQEVLHEGDEQQRSEAQALLGKLG